MKYIITEKQYAVLTEQPESRFGPQQYMSHSERRDYQSGNSQKAADALVSGSKKQMEYIQSLDPHTTMAIFQIGTAFIPFVGPFIAAGIGALDAALYYKEGDNTSAALAGVFSLLPAVGTIVRKIPGVKQLGTKGMAALAKKISLGGKNLTKAELEVTNSIKTFQKQVQDELTKLAPKLKSIMKEVEMYKPNFVKKYGEVKYNFELANFLDDTSPKARVNFVNKLKI
jgi:hypothetical protein